VDLLLATATPAAACAVGQLKGIQMIDPGLVLMLVAGTFAFGIFIGWVWFYNPMVKAWKYECKCAELREKAWRSQAEASQRIIEEIRQQVNRGVKQTIEPR
jgi:hypothetical protein